MTQTAHLPTRSVIAITGADRVAFLNGLVSNDVAEAAPGRAVWAALLTAQGKWLADFFILADQDRLLLDCEASHAPMLTQRLSRYRLRADVAIASSRLNVFTAWNGAPTGDDGVAAPDPRLPNAGWRILTADLPVTTDAAAWDAHRLALGLPDGSRDMESDKSVLLEAGFDELHGISWTKGCYMGQELTARTRYRGLVKRRLLPVHGDAELPPAGTPVMHRDREVGVMRSSLGGHGLALLRVDAIAAEGLLADGRRIQPRVPDWAVLPEAA